MALSFESVQKAYKVFNQIKKEVLPSLQIPSWPTDFQKLSREDQENPPMDQVLGYAKQYDNGWENLFFLTKSPSPELIKLFNELKGNVPNTAFKPERYEKTDYWLIGWF